MKFEYLIRKRTKLRQNYLYNLENYKNYDNSKNHKNRFYIYFAFHS